MKTLRLLIPVLALGLLVLSCSKSSTPVVSQTVAQKTFTDVSSSVADDLKGMNSAPGGQALNSFANVTSSASPFGRISGFKNPGDVKAAVSAGVNSIAQMIAKGTASDRVQSDTPFDFNSKKGIYEWNGKSFTKSATASDIIQIRYPKDSLSVNNDAELQITAFTDVQTATGYQPTLIQAAIYVPVGGTKEAGLTLTASSYDSNGNPGKASIDLYINPYTISFSFDDTQPTSATESFSFSNADKKVIDMSFTALYASAADKTNGSAPRSITGYFQLSNVRFNVAFDGSKLATAQTPGDVITITVSIDGGYAGHVVWKYDDVKQDYVAYMEYTDGTDELLETVFAKLKAQIDALMPS